MKLIAVLSLMLMSAPALATSIQAEQVEELSRVIINGQEDNQKAAVLKLDFVRNSIRVDIYNDSCGHYFPRERRNRCLGMPYIVKTLQVPLQSRDNSCGSRIYSGTSVGRPTRTLRSIGGTEIVVYDHNTRICDDIVAGLIEVRAQESDPATGEFTQYHLLK